MLVTVLAVLSLVPTILLAGEFALRGAQLVFAGQTWRGTPPFRGEMRRGEEASVGFATRVASLQFPDLEACLVSGDETGRERLTRFDWRAIDNSRQANVCVFRVLEAWGNVHDAPEWFRSQGFSPSPDAPLAVTHLGPRLLRVDGMSSIREDGPRFTSPRFYTYFFPEAAYAFSFSSYWSEDGETLRFVTVQYQYL